MPVYQRKKLFGLVTRRPGADGKDRPCQRPSYGLIVRIASFRCGNSRGVVHLEGKLGAALGGGHEEHDSQRVVGLLHDRDGLSEAYAVTTWPESNAAHEDGGVRCHQPTKARAVCSKSPVESRSDS